RGCVAGRNRYHRSDRAPCSARVRASQRPGVQRQAPHGYRGLNRSGARRGFPRRALIALGADMRISRVAIVSGLAAAMLVAGGVGLLTNTKSVAETPPVPLSIAASPSEIMTALQRRLASVPRDWSAWASLGGVYVQTARRTGDPSFYPKAQGALER